MTIPVRDWLTPANTGLQKFGYVEGDGKSDDWKGILEGTPVLRTLIVHCLELSKEISIKLTTLPKCEFGR